MVNTFPLITKCLEEFEFHFGEVSLYACNEVLIMLEKDATLNKNHNSRNKAKNRTIFFKKAN